MVRGMKRQELLVGGAFETETARLRDLAPRIERTGEGVVCTQYSSARSFGANGYEDHGLSAASAHAYRW
jgi:hypothetical protein